MRSLLMFVVLYFHFSCIFALSNSLAGMVVTEQYLASEIGAKVLQKGGNAVDAAVAVGYALAVVNPCCGNIGGGGFMLIHFANGKNTFINFRERAPLRARTTLYLDTKGNRIQKRSVEGYLAVATPGTVLGLETALKKYGTLPRKNLMQPAIKLAEKGFILHKGDVELLKPETAAFLKQSNVRTIFLNHKKPWKAGERLIQKDLAKTLKLIADKGPSVFYKGTIAKQLITASRNAGGILTSKDFSSYFVEELNPILCTYRGYKLVTAPPPSSGGITLCEILNILEGYSLNSTNPYHLKNLYYLIQSMHLGFADRNFKLGDPNYVKNPIKQLISKKYAAYLRAKIPPFEQAAKIHIHVQHLPEGKSTTHYSIVDKYGNAVAVTYTLNSFFGAKVIAGKTGFFLNNEMDDFTIGKINQFGLKQGEKNKIEPGKRPLSSMTPTFIFKKVNHGSSLFMVLGSPGGPRIITSTLLTLLNVIDFGMSLSDAVAAKRIHYQQSSNVIDIEKNALNQKEINFLKKLNFETKAYDKWGAVEAILIRGSKIWGANDPRRPAGQAVLVK